MSKPKTVYVKSEELRAIIKKQIDGTITRPDLLASIKIDNVTYINLEFNAIVQNPNKNN